MEYISNKEKRMRERERENERERERKRFVHTLSTGLLKSMNP